MIISHVHIIIFQVDMIFFHVDTIFLHVDIVYVIMHNDIKHVGGRNMPLMFKLIFLTRTYLLLFFIYFIEKEISFTLHNT